MRINGNWRLGLGGLVLITWGVAGLMAPRGVLGQNGVSSASASRTRGQSESLPASGGFGRAASVPPSAPDKIAVEEIVNFRRHQLPLPKSGQAVRLDLRWGNDIAVPGQPSVLQVGLATPEFIGTSDLRPVNLGLVIDTSGSMSGAGKLTMVKAALQSLVSNLRPTDIVSVVRFDDSASVVLPAGPLGDGRAYRRAIESLAPGGSTNLNDGLMTGYREVFRNFRPDNTNRVIVLTDGIANMGERDPRRIAENSSDFNERGIDLSTIGVGQDLDNNLLRTLAKRGRGLYHFVADPSDISKVFVNEAQSLLSAVARHVRVEILSDTALGPERVFGYEPRRTGERLSFDMDDLNSGATEVIMMQYRPESVGQVAVRLQYFDIVRQKDVDETHRISLIRGTRDGNFLLDTEVRTNYAIATIAQGLSDMQQSWQRGDLRGAERIVRTAIRDAEEQSRNRRDPDVRTQLEVAQNYLTTLERFNGPRFD